MQSGLAVLIMAGGKGERFWPRSRAALPKQFLRLCGAGTLLQETFRRAARLVPPSHVFVVTPLEYGQLVREQLPALPAENLILEPAGRDTAPAIGLGALFLERRYPDATMIVLPSDHVIANEQRFLEVLRAAAEAAGQGRHLVTVGITPTRPETGYGYVQCGEPIAEVRGQTVRAVLRFTEKPAREQALQFLSTGEYLWNAGIFVWKASTLRAKMAAHLPWLHEGLARIAAALGTPGEEETVAREFASFQKISIDYGLMERAEDVAVIPGDFGWDDVGSWAALERVGEPDEAGNVIEGRVVAVDTRRCIIVSSAEDEADDPSGGRLVVTYGVDGLLIVDTPDVVLVADKTQSANLRHLVEEVRRRGYGARLDGHPPCAFPAPPAFADARQWRTAGDGDAGALRVVEKPWGREIWWAETDRYVGKLIEVKAGHSLSLQYHRVKRETQLFVRGRGTVVLGDRLLPIREGLCVSIPPGTVHRVIAHTAVAFYEVSTPETDDVVRLADAYGRAPAQAAGGT